MNSKIKTLAADTAIFAIGSVGSKLILFFLVPLYTNVLTAEQFGSADLLISIGQLIMPFASLVIADAVLRFGLSRNEKTEDVLLSAFIVLLGGCVLCIVTTPLLGLYSAIQGYEWHLFWYVLFFMFSNVELTYLKATNRNKLYVTLSIFQTLLIATLNVVLLVVLNFGVDGYLLSNIFALALVDIVAFFAGRFPTALRNSSFDSFLLRRMLAYSAPLVLNNVSWWVIHSADKVLVEWALGAVALGLFTAASKIPSLINTLVSIFQQAWGISSIREIESTNDSAYYSKVFLAYGMLCLGACIALVTVIKPFMALYVGSDYFEAWRFVPFLLVSAALSGIASFFGQMYGALKKSVNSMISTLVAALVNVGICFALLDACGIWSAVFGTLASYATLAAIRIFDVLRFVKFDVHLRRCLPCLFIALAQAACVCLDLFGVFASVIAVVTFAFINRDLIGKVFHHAIR